MDARLLLARLHRVPTAQLQRQRQLSTLLRLRAGGRRQVREADGKAGESRAAGQFQDDPHRPSEVPRKRRRGDATADGRRCLLPSQPVLLSGTDDRVHDAVFERLLVALSAGLYASLFVNLYAGLSVSVSAKCLLALHACLFAGWIRSAETRVVRRNVQRPKLQVSNR